MESDHVDRLERRIGHVERELAVHSTQLARNSDAIQHMRASSEERLQYIREQFEESRRRDEKILNHIDGKTTSNKWALNLVLSIVFAFVVGVNYVYIEPIIDSVKTIERRILDVEKTLRGVALNSQPK